MAPRKRKPRKTVLEQEERPEITLDISEVGAKAPEVTYQKDKAGRTERTRQNLERVKHKDGVIGYIFRNAESASIDVKDPGKIIDYAFLSSSALETCDMLSDAFGLGDVKHILIDGNATKFLSFKVEESKVSVFMEKKVDHKRVFKDLQS
jgi:predicted regulator of Ras-like GTPase activity (Roadblock/LC7/MglB family)